MHKKMFNKYAVAGISDVGCVRKQNEDSFLIDEELGLLLVADGLGGHQFGEVASMQAINVIQSMLQFQQTETAYRSWLGRLRNKTLKPSILVAEKQVALEKLLQKVNYYLYQFNVEGKALSGTGMGTTIAGCWLLSAEIMLVFHVGDSRVYRLRDGELQALTNDHSLYQAWLDGGCEDECPSANVIVQALGPNDNIDPDISCIQIEDEDSFLLCSDGLTDMLDEQAIERVFSRMSGQWPEKCCQGLLQAALEKGGRDNVSIICMTHAY